MRVARGEVPPSLRLYRPAAAVEFGRLDRQSPGFDAATRAARDHSFAPVLRMVGGHAAAHDHQSLIVEHFTAGGDFGDLHARFEDGARRLVTALTQLDVDARVGAIDGEYCAGDYSINSRGTLKVAGLAQRVIKGAALLSAVVVVGGGERIRSVLVDVYRELGIDWRPATAGALQDHHPGLGVTDVERSIRAQFAGENAWVEDAATLELAEELAPSHRL
jgi:lipoate-protein ligase A